MKVLLVAAFACFSSANAAIAQTTIGVGGAVGQNRGWVTSRVETPPLKWFSFRPGIEIGLSSIAIGTTIDVLLSSRGSPSRFVPYAGLGSGAYFAKNGDGVHGGPAVVIGARSRRLFVETRYHLVGRNASVAIGLLFVP